MEGEQVNGTAFHQELCALAVQMAEAAGAIILDGVEKTRVMDTKSSATDLVTEMDKAAEELIVSMIDEFRAADGILGEEGTSRVGTSGVRWVIDPIDGTTNYVYRHPLFAVSVGVQVEDTTVAGAVCVPMLGETYSAYLGGGAKRNEQAISCSTEADVARALVGTGFAYRAEYRTKQGARVAKLLPQVRDLRRGGSAATDLCFVADGRLDAYFEDGLSPWDECAGLLIATEAGARFDRLEWHRSTLFVANPFVFHDLRSTLQAAGDA